MSIYNNTLTQLENKLIELGGKKFNAKQIFEWIYKKNVSSFKEMTNISKKFIEKLEPVFNFSKLDFEQIKESSDGTIKFLFKLNDGNLVETVLMRHNYGNSICVTTQVGCNIGCKFCASGLLKKKRDLETFEIVLQILQVQEYIKDRISHVVIMGIGEPFDNYDNVLSFINIINSPYGLEIGARHITVSTSGLVPMIDKFSEEPMQVNLAISLHASNNDIRSELMVINNKYNMNELKQSIIRYINKTNRRVTIEYILLKDINDSLDNANELIDYLRGLNVYVNLIPYNSVDESGFKRSSKDNMDKFFKRLQDRKIQCTLRREHGHDIDAACGQLRAKVEKMNKK